MESQKINNIEAHKNQSRVSIIGGDISDIFHRIGNLNIDIISKNNTEGSNIIVLSCNNDVANMVIEAIGKDLSCTKIDNLTKISITGIGIKNNTKIFYGILSALNEINIKIFTIETSEVKISVLINENDQDLAVKKISELDFSKF